MFGASSPREYRVGSNHACGGFRTGHGARTTSGEVAMSLAYTPDRLKLPESLQAQLHEFRRRVWTIKLVEAVSASVFGILIAYLLLFGLDRVWDTPGWLRLSLFAAAAIGCANLPVALHRWVWRNRHLEQLARLLSRKHPRVGDQLLGVIELVRNDFEQARSRDLCEAAIREVAQDAQRRDFRDAVPNPRHRLWAWLVAVPVVLALGLFTAFPAAASNTWMRFLAPWKNTPRYTFTTFDRLPDQMVVAHGEPFTVPVRLSDNTVWHPAKGSAQLGQQRPVTAQLQGGRYAFELPAQIDPGYLTVKIGDRSERARIEPTLRPELTSVVADVSLPAYLGLPKPVRKDVRGGTVSIVEGSHATFAATASRELASALVDGQSQSPDGATVSSQPTAISGTRDYGISLAGQIRPRREGAVHSNDHRTRRRSTLDRL